MATRQQKAMLEKGNHAVGNLNNIKIKTVNHGALVIDADVDNFTWVELGFNADGERTAKQLSNKATKGYLIASPELRNMEESLVDFYNAVGERARIVVPEQDYTRFDTSAYTLNTGVTEIKEGQVAHFDVATKKFIISNPTAAHTDYAGSYNQFLVVNSEDDLEYVAGKATVRLEVSKA